MAPQVSSSRALRAAKRLAHRVQAESDVIRHRSNPLVRRWGRTMAGATAGHFVLPSHAIRASVAEAAEFAGTGLVRPGDRVLDVGSGNGRQLLGLLELDIGSYVGLEIIRECVEYSRRAFAGYDQVRFDWLDVANPMYNPGGGLHADAVTFPYGDEEFNVVIAGSLFTHLQTVAIARHYLSECSRVLRRDGRAFTSWFRSPPNDLAADALRSVFGESDIRALVGEHFVVTDERGGTSVGWHDQWQLWLVKR